MSNMYCPRRLIVCLNVRRRHIRHVFPRYYTFRIFFFKFTSVLSSEEPAVLKNECLNSYA